MSLLVFSLPWRHSAFWSDQKVNYWSGCKRTSRNSRCWTNEEDDSTHNAWNSLWSACQRVGFRCQHIWFGFSDLNWPCRTTSREQLCGFLTRVSLLDLVLWWSSWSLPHCLQGCTTETRLEKNVCLVRVWLLFNISVAPFSISVSRD